MFEGWPARFEPRIRREVDPPVAVIVDLAAGLARSAVHAANDLPLRVRSEGLVADVQIPGTLHAWARTNRGDWLGRCRVRIPAGSDGFLDTEQWFPAAAIRRSDTF